MTAVIRNNAGEDRFIPLAGGVVPDGETFELADDEFDQYDFTSEDFHVVTEPKRSAKKRAAKKTARAPRKTAAKKPAAKKPAETSDAGDTAGTPTEPAPGNDETTKES